jgi:hypothetical protein
MSKENFYTLSEAYKRGLLPNTTCRMPHTPYAGTLSCECAGIWVCRHTRLKSPRCRPIALETTWRSLRKTPISHIWHELAADASEDSCLTEPKPKPKPTRIWHSVNLNEQPLTIPLAWHEFAEDARVCMYVCLTKRKHKPNA